MVLKKLAGTRSVWFLLFIFHFVIVTIIKLFLLSMQYYISCSFIDLYLHYQLLTEVQQNAVEFINTVLSLVTCLQLDGGNEFLFELSKRLLSVQRDHGLTWPPGLSSTMVSLWTILVQSELEHVQISILKLISTILKWKYESGKIYSSHFTFGFYSRIHVEQTD